MASFFKKAPSTETTSITPSQAETLTEEHDSLQRFTATGRPMPKYDPSSLANMNDGCVAQSPQFLPMRFTDASILSIPIPISLIPPHFLTSSAPPTTTSTLSPSPPPPRRLSLFSRLSANSNSSSSHTDKKTGKTKDGFKMVKMTRKEYLRFWAKDEEGRYVGEEPEGEREKFWSGRVGLDG